VPDGPAPPVDFDELQRRLDEVEAQLGEAPRGGDRRRALMAERAHALGAPREAVNEDALPLLVFTLGGVSHAVEVEAVVQVLDSRGLQRLVATPAWLLGALVARGRVVPVLDLRRRLGLARGLGDLGKVLVVEHDGELVGIAVEGLEGRRDVARRTLGEAASPLRWRGADGLAVLELSALLAPRGLG
jgi:purine-binding chemotaxis protein CheW